MVLETSRIRLPAVIMSPIAACSSRVFPVPGGPHTSQTPAPRQARYASCWAGKSPGGAGASDSVPPISPRASRLARPPSGSPAMPSRNAVSRKSGGCRRIQTCGSGGAANSATRIRSKRPSTVASMARKPALTLSGAAPARHNSVRWSALRSEPRMSTTKIPGSAVDRAAPTRRHCGARPPPPSNAIHWSSAVTTSSRQPKRPLHANDAPMWPNACPSGDVCPAADAKSCAEASGFCPDVSHGIRSVVIVGERSLIRNSHNRANA